MTLEQYLSAAAFTVVVGTASWAVAVCVTTGIIGVISLFGG